MTWIIGSPRVFGYSLLLSDVRVTFADGSELDCLQKIYPIGRFLVAGFAGSVGIGLTIIGELQQWLFHTDETKAYIPQETAELLPFHAQDVFARFPEEERQNGCELILAGIHPTDNMGDAPFARPSVFVFRAPDFKPESAVMNAFVSIGSGGYVDEYRDALERLSGFHERFMKIETMSGPLGHGGGSFLSMLLRKEMEDRPNAGISRHFHICIVRRGAITLGNNDEDVYPADGEKIEFRMPPIARNLKELEEILGARSPLISDART